jgi:hypothetical protein
MRIKTTNSVHNYCFFVTLKVRKLAETQTEWSLFLFDALINCDFYVGYADRTD